MASKPLNSRPPFSDDEYKRAHDAYEEYQEKGGTSLRCLRCGGAFRFVRTQSSLEIRCEAPDCFVERIRGV